LGFYTNSTVPTTEDGVATVKAADRPDKKHSSAENRRWIVEALTKRGLAQTWKAATGKEVA